MLVSTKFKTPISLRLSRWKRLGGVDRPTVCCVFPQENKWDRPGFTLTSYLELSTPRVSGDSGSGSGPTGAEG